MWRPQLHITKISALLACIVLQAELLVTDTMCLRQAQMQLYALLLHLDHTLWDNQLQTAVRVRQVSIAVLKHHFQPFVQEVSIALLIRLLQQLAPSEHLGPVKV